MGKGMLKYTSPCLCEKQGIANKSLNIKKAYRRVQKNPPEVVDFVKNLLIIFFRKSF